MQTVIETKGLCKTYGKQLAVDHVALQVPKGCVYGFIGPNGAGKSTTMKMLLGLIHPSAGQVFLLGKELTPHNRLTLLRQTGSLIESPSGYLHLTARENLQIVADLKGISHRDIARVLEIVHLTQDRDRKVGQFSLGMKQRLGIAMALLGSPKLLILDEPTNGLDPAGIQEMRALIADMPAATGATVLISSHLLGEMEQMVEQVGIIHHGRMLFEGPLHELQRHSRGDLSIRLLHPQKGLAILQANGISVRQKEDVLTLPPLRDEPLAGLVQALADGGAGVVELNRHTKSLEEIFLSLTDRKEVDLNAAQSAR
ncbi:ABC transporter ATP-binding protein [uncultured Subdoligranulum sp.]|uniref:ABC transporter ATP-binding protein n=1 Tax=uncultured Subdoligranulum sp. TaxID=512298 RepID=UPI0025F03643|nr:ABC transporter ATP-binding protein [uncultured Subdoligranulum sp.]